MAVKKTSTPTTRRASRSAAAAKVKAAKQQADTLAADAGKAGALGPNLPPYQAAMRNSLIQARRMQGVEWAAIAEEVGLSVRACQRAVRQAADTISPLDRTPMELIEGLVKGFANSIADYEGMALAWARTNQSASLGAKKAADEMRSKLVETLTAVGKLPTDLETFRAQAELEYVAREILTLLESMRDGHVSAQQVIDELPAIMAPRSAEVPRELGAG